MIARIYARLGLSGLIIAALLAALVVQTIRIEGLKVWPLSIDGWKPLAIERGETIENIRKAQQVAADKARLARLEQEAIYREEARKADAREHAIREEALDLAERYIAANRVRPEAYRGPPSGAGSSPESGSPESDNGPRGAPELDEGLVAVTAEDVRICTRNTARLIAGREWGLGL